MIPCLKSVYHFVESVVNLTERRKRVSTLLCVDGKRAHSFASYVDLMIRQNTLFPHVLRAWAKLFPFFSISKKKIPCLYVLCSIIWFVTISWLSIQCLWDLQPQTQQCSAAKVTKPTPPPSSFFIPESGRLARLYKSPLCLQGARWHHRRTCQRGPLCGHICL